MKKIFLKEKAELLLRNKSYSPRLFTEELVSDLPEPIIKYLRVCGYMNTAVPVNADVYWSENFIKLSPDKEWGELETIQFNSVTPIARMAYMRFLKMPVAGRDIYLDGYGEMKGKLLNLFRIIFDNGRETAQSILLTTFCEFFMVPGYLLSENVKWETIDSQTARGILTDNGIRVTAIFHFNEDGFLIHVETGDRYYSEGRNKSRKVPFSAVIESYKNQGDIKIPEKMMAVWHFPEGDYEYYKGTIDRVEYNVQN